MFCIKELLLNSRRRIGSIRHDEVGPAPAWNKLRIDANDGSPVVEYRIDGGGVERRTVETATHASSATEVQWQRLRPVELIFHVMANTVLAQWLLRRLGAHALAQACSQDCHP